MFNYVMTITSLLSENLGATIFIAFIGFLIGIVIMYILSKLGYNKVKQEAVTLLENSKQQAETTIREAVLEGKTAVYELRLSAEKEIKERRNELAQYENRLDKREDNLNLRDKQLISGEQSLDAKTNNLNNRTKQLEKMEVDLQEKIDSQIVELEKISQLNVEQAREQIIDLVEKRMEHEAAVIIRDKTEEANEKAEQIAREIIAIAVDRYAQEEVTERTVSVIQLPNDEMKGRIIGREGRNIRAIEHATGVDLMIDDTPEVITISSHNPIRREIARQSIETLIKDGRIQPGRIEEVVTKVEKDVDRTIQKAGEDAIFEVGLHKVDKELVKLLGRLKYRTSYGQNALRHSVEVAYLAGMMAAELGLNQQLAKRAGLFHDIGKALDFEIEGSHVELGVRYAKRYNEHPVVINAIESHHGDVDKTSLISNLVSAADTLSAARPGARIENFENYIQRLEQLENIAKSYDGVEQTYAIQAGREIRVMVVPEKIDDAKAAKLAMDIRDRIENEMTYPGQIKVTVIRELRKSETAK